MWEEVPAFLFLRAERSAALEIFDIMLKAAYLGLSGVGISLPMLTYLVYGSLKKGVKAGALLFCGHLTVSAAAGAVILLGGGGIFGSVGLGVTLRFFECGGICRPGNQPSGFCLSEADGDGAGICGAAGGGD